MKQKKLGPLLAVTLSIELMIAPIVPAVQAQTPTRPPSGSTNTVNGGMDAVNKGLQVLDTVLQSVRQNQAPPTSPQFAKDMSGLQGQQSPGPDKYFNLQKLGQIPGLANYLALNNINPNSLNCPTLPTTLYDARPEVCRLGITGDSGVNQQAQLSQMFGYYNQYFQVSKVYKNYTADSNADGQAFGVGCMNNAMNVLNGFFKYRIDELDKLTTNLEAMQNQFREASRADLDAIEESVAVLDGDSAIADKVRSKNPDLFDFKKRFDNPACNSMFAGEALNDRGRAGGLNTINTELKKTLTAKNGKYSGESYATSHNAVMEDINNLADKVAKQFELNYTVLSKDAATYGNFLSSLPGSVSSTHGTNRAITPDLFSDVQSKFNESFMKLSEKKSTIQSELQAAGIGSDVATNLLGNTTSSNFDNEVATIERRLKNQCFEKTLSDVNVDRLMDKIHDPSSSGFANKNASNFYKDKLNEILSDKDSSLERKLTQLKTLEAQTGGRYYLKMDSSYEKVNANGETATELKKASTRRTPTVYFSDLIGNCEAQFKANKLNNKLSGANAIQQLKNLNQEYKALAKSQAADLKKELRKKMIECENPEDANNTVPGSCTPERFNTGTPGFCAKAAFSCSKNMQACSQQADNFVKEIKTQKTARVNNYKALVQKNKQDIVKIFDSALTRYMKDAEVMRGVFGAGFSSPAGVQREVPEGQRYLAEFQEATSKSPDGRLLLEDPDKYVDMFKRNIDLLKQSVKKQQDQILGGDSVGTGKNPGLLADHIKKTRDNYKEVIREADQYANQCINNHDNAIRAAEAARAEQMKKQSELGEKQQEYCRRFNMAAGGNPNPACSGSINDMVTIGNGSLERLCNETQNSSSEGSSGSRGSRALRICYQEGLIVANSPATPESPALTTALESQNSANDAVETAREAKETAQTAFNRANDTNRAERETALTQAETALREAERAKRTADAAVARINAAQSPTPTAEGLAGSCQRLVQCNQETDVVNRDGEVTRTRPGCSTDEKEVAISMIFEETNAQPTVTSEDAPAFCTAGNNSDRGNFQNILDTIQRNLTPPQSAGTYQ